MPTSLYSEILPLSTVESFRQDAEDVPRALIAKISPSLLRWVNTTQRQINLVLDNWEFKIFSEQWLWAKQELKRQLQTMLALTNRNQNMEGNQGFSIGFLRYGHRHSSSSVSMRTVIWQCYNHFSVDATVLRREGDFDRFFLEAYVHTRCRDIAVN